MLSRCHVTAYSIHQEKKIGNFFVDKALVKKNDDIMASLHKPKMALRDSMLGSEINSFHFRVNLICLHESMYIWNILKLLIMCIIDKF